jgi:hypothetical protein
VVLMDEIFSTTVWPFFRVMAFAVLVVETTWALNPKFVGESVTVWHWSEMGNRIVMQPARTEKRKNAIALYNERDDLLDQEQPTAE